MLSTTLLHEEKKKKLPVLSFVFHRCVENLRKIKSHDNLFHQLYMSISKSLSMRSWLIFIALYWNCIGTSNKWRLLQQFLLGNCNVSWWKKLKECSTIHLYGVILMNFIKVQKCKFTVSEFFVFLWPFYHACFSTQKAYSRDFFFKAF